MCTKDEVYCTACIYDERFILYNKNLYVQLLPYIINNKDTLCKHINVYLASIVLLCKRVFYHPTIRTNKWILFRSSLYRNCTTLVVKQCNVIYGECSINLSILIVFKQIFKSMFEI